MCDGSTETLSVTEIDPSRPAASSGAPEAIDPPQAQGLGQELLASGTEDDQQTDVGDMNPQSRSLSMDSAYGTLSPQSELELQGPSPTDEGEEMEGGGKEEQTMLGEGAEEEEKEEEAEEEDQQKEKRQERGKEEGEAPSSNVSVHVAHTQKPRRRPPVQLRVHALQALHNKSRSEDNLLQRLQSDLSAKTPPSSLAAKQWQGTGQRRESKASGRVCHSRSLSELGRGRDVNTLSNHTGQNTPPEMIEDELTQSLPAGRLSSALKVAQGLQRSGQVDCLSTHTEAMALSGGQEGEDTKDTALAEEAHSKRSPGQQHKKLTLAQLYRIRTTMVLNSTLTAS